MNLMPRGSLPPVARAPHGALLAFLLGTALPLLCAGAAQGADAPVVRTVAVKSSPPTLPGHPIHRVAPVATLVPEREVAELLGWAIHLADYDGAGLDVPPVRLENDAFFARYACRGGHRCRVLGWYADRGVVHLHEDLAGLDSLFTRSLLVHELVHYLQHASGHYAAHDCASFVAREREAYAVQQRFFIAYGAQPTIRPHHFACPEASAHVAVSTIGR